jgi:hypothetical protein
LLAAVSNQSWAGGMIGDRQVMKRRLREGKEFFQFLRDRKHEERETQRQRVAVTT